mgnify:FL=1
MSRAKAVFIPPAELVVVARSSYPAESRSPRRFSSVANGFFAALIFTGRRKRRSLLNADTGASLFYTSFAEAEYFQPCNALAHLNPSANSNKFELVP